MDSMMQDGSIWGIPGEWLQVQHVPIRRLVMGPKSATQTPVVLVHGYAASLFTWREVQPALAQYGETHSFDLPGMGYSHMPQKDFSLRLFVEFIRNYLDQENLDQIDLIGHSMGGGISTLFALTYPERVRRLVLLCPLVNFARVQKNWLGMGLHLGATPGLAHAILAFHNPRITRHFLKRIMVNHDAINEDLVLGYHQPIRGIRGRRTLYKTHQMLMRFENLDLVHRIKDLEVPCQVLWGEQDPLVPFGDAVYFESLLDRLELFSLKACGHMLMHEYPESVCRHIEKFLKN